MSLTKGTLYFSTVKYRIFVRFCQVLLAILPTYSQPIHTETADYPHHQPESFFRTIIRRFHLSIQHHFHCHRNRLYQKSVIIYSTKNLSTIIKDDFSHHYPTADFIQSSFSVQNIFFSIPIFSISTIFLHYTNYSNHIKL